MKQYKLRIYNTSGANKGNLNHEELFSTPEEMQKRYTELFVYNLFSLNPTAWAYRNGEWDRVSISTK